MSQFEGKIAVTGASGQLGRRVVELLADKVEPSRLLAITRSPEKLAELADRGVQVAFGDFAKPAELTRALEGVDRLLIISTDDIHGNRAALHANALGAAMDAKVSHVVYTSAPAPGSSSLEFVREHAVTEDLIRKSGLPFTFLRNCFYTDMLLGTAPKWAATGEIRGVAAEGKVNRVTREDCARSAAAVMAAPGNAHHNMVYDISGPAAMTGNELAEVLARVAGRPVRYVQISSDQLREYLVDAGFPEPMAGLFVEIDQSFANGEHNITSTAVRDLTGVEPTSVADMLAAHSALFPAANAVA